MTPYKFQLRFSALSRVYSAVYILPHMPRVIHYGLVKWCKTEGKKISGCLCEGITYHLVVSAGCNAYHNLAVAASP